MDTTEQATIAMQIDSLRFDNGPQKDKAEIVFYRCLLASEGGFETYLKFCGVWSGYSEELAKEALMFFSSGNLAADLSLELSADLIERFLLSPEFERGVKPWFQGICCDGERASRTLSYMLYYFVEFTAGFEREVQEEERPEEPQYVSREMAMDAQDPSLEGTRY